MGANHPREIAAPRRDRASPTSAWSSMPARRTSRASAASRASRSGKGEMFAGARRRAAPRSSTPTIASRRSGTASRARAGRVVTFGMRERGRLHAPRDVAQPCSTAGGFVDRVRRWSRRPAARRVALALAGEHNVMNALAAAAAAHGRRRRPRRRRRRARPSMRAGRRPARSSSRRCGGARLIDDSYNANPGSMRAGLRALAGAAGRALAGARRDGASSGEDAPQLHAEIGAFARECGVDAPARRRRRRRGTRSSPSAPGATLVRERRGR